MFKFLFFGFSAFYSVVFAFKTLNPVWKFLVTNSYYQTVGDKVLEFLLRNFFGVLNGEVLRLF